MIFFAIVDYQKEDIKKGIPSAYKLISTSDLRTVSGGIMNEHGVIDTIRTVGIKGCVCVNFDIKQGKIVETAGSFSRLEVRNGVAPRVLIAEYVSPIGRVLGYVLADRNGNLTRVKRDVLLKAFADARKSDVSFCQNAIYRQMDNKETISPYQGNTFYKIVQKFEKKLPSPKMPEHIKPTAKDKSSVSNMSGTVEQGTASKVDKPLKNSERYSDAQKKELIAAKKYGVDPLIVSNPKFSPEQMRIIWTAKKNGMASEYFANPKFSVEQMRFFSERLTDKDMFNECKYIINPKYNIDQLTELYLGVCDGIDYTQYANPEITAEDMYCKRQELTCSTYAPILVGGVDTYASDLFLRKLNGTTDKNAK